MRMIRNIMSGITWMRKREAARVAYWDMFDAAWSRHFHAWN